MTLIISVIFALAGVVIIVFGGRIASFIRERILSGRSTAVVPSTARQVRLVGGVWILVGFIWIAAAVLTRR